ncbi:preprotein translocase subunit YajC [Neorickettsia risticii]|nr:preprotein translocase subunit YajC [Neorickettsia risticii]
MSFSQIFTSTSTGSDSILLSLLPLGIVFFVFYVFVIRPQSKKMRDHQNMLKALKVGDPVITTSGISGTVARIDEKNDMVHLQVAEGVIVKILKNFISEKR